MKAIIVLGIACVLLTSFSIRQSKSQKRLKERPEAIKLESFKKLPSEIDGCSCYFYASEKDQKAEKYLLVNDYANTAFVMLNGRLEKFALKSHDEKRNTFVYSIGQYILEVKVTRWKRSGYEESALKGVIKLTKAGYVLQQRFVGSCGC